MHILQCIFTKMEHKYYQINFCLIIPRTNCVENQHIKCLKNLKRLIDKGIENQNILEIYLKDFNFYF